MIVDLADPEDDQTANNFEVITRVIVNISEIATGNISLQPLINVRYMEPSMIKTYVSDSWPAFLYYDVCHCCVFSIH